MKNNIYPATLLLDNGETYQGWSFTKTFTTCGEVVFNTGMTGYQEIMTDPSYSDQIIIFTYPEIGNTGINDHDNESIKIYIKGIIAKNICIHPYNWRSNISLYKYLIQQNIPHIFGIDTRKLTKYIRSKGVMQGYISSKALQIKDLRENQYILSETIKDKIKSITTNKPYTLSKNNKSEGVFSYLNNKENNQSNNIFDYKIVVIDFGIKINILRRLLEYECKVFIIPATSSYKFILSHQPDGILLSNGPGDPLQATYAIKNIERIIKSTNIPIFGICMGHQIISLALECKTFKLKFGHRGINHPSGNNQISEITSQNHGFAVKLTKKSENTIKITHFNLNDSTIAGLLHTNKPVFSIQYHPEACPGPHDSEYLFIRFLQMIKILKNSNNLT
uniref:Carbamoyl phosphate synthase small chain n=1 Tax=Pterocladia lucida TaxID=31408 RepID=A0A6M3WWL4_PTELU|nr:CarA [Pterocladia lucida]